MSIVIAVLGAIFAIFSVVIVHEFGHFIVARAVGVRVLRFSIGFGRAIWSRTSKSGTVFAIGWMPLGGYVRMLGEGDEAPPADMKAYSYNEKSVIRRMAIVLAGPAMNFIFAILLYWILFLPGTVSVKPVIGQVLPNSIAAQVGLKPMSQITEVDKKPVKNWRSVVMAMIGRMGDKNEMTLTVAQPPSFSKKTFQIPLATWKVDERRPEFLKTLGIVPYQPKLPMIIGKVLSASPAEQSGFQQGDQVLKVNGKRYDDMLTVVKLVQAHPGKTFQFEIERKGAVKTISVKAGSKQVNHEAVGFLGFQLTPPKWPASMLLKEDFNVLTAWRPAANQLWSLIKFNSIVIAKMFIGKVSVRSLGGPISIFQMAGKASQKNYRVFLGFLAFFSVTLGFINLLPIPGLDGGHFFFQLIEVVFRRPVPLPAQAMAIRIGLFLLILLIIRVTFNDIVRIFGQY